MREDIEQQIQNSAARVELLTQQVHQEKEKLYEAIHRGAEAGLSGDQLSALSGLSRSSIHRDLSRSGKSIDSGIARYHDFERSVFVFVNENPFDDDSSLSTSDVLHIASRKHVDAESISQLEYLVVILNKDKYHKEIIADWRLDSDEPIKDGRFRPADVSSINDRGVVGRRFSMQGEKASKHFTLSSDIR